MNAGYLRRGAGLARLAAARRRRQPGRSCRSCTASPASGADRDASCRGCPATRAPRRCASATPRPTSCSSTSIGEVMDALHQRRARRARRATPALGAAARAARASRDDLARARRRHLGGARRAAALHPFQGDGLGGVRPRGQERRDVRPAGPVDRWRALRDEIHDEVCAKGFDPERGSFRAVLRRDASSTRACC